MASGRFLRWLIAQKRDAGQEVRQKVVERPILENLERGGIAGEERQAPDRDLQVHHEPDAEQQGHRADRKVEQRRKQVELDLDEKRPVDAVDDADRSTQPRAPGVLRNEGPARQQIDRRHRPGRVGQGIQHNEGKHRAKQHRREQASKTFQREIGSVSACLEGHRDDEARHHEKQVDAQASEAQQRHVGERAAERIEPCHGRLLRQIGEVVERDHEQHRERPESVERGDSRGRLPARHRHARTRSSAARIVTSMSM